MAEGGVWRGEQVQVGGGVGWRREQVQARRTGAQRRSGQSPGVLLQDGCWGEPWESHAHPPGW